MEEGEHKHQQQQQLVEGDFSSTYLLVVVNGASAESTSIMRDASASRAPPSAAAGKPWPSANDIIFVLRAQVAVRGKERDSNKIT